VNLGLRYDFQQQAWERYDQLMNFDLAGESSASGLLGQAVYAGMNGQPRQWREARHTDFGPRVGFAYDLFGRGTRVLRGGYGVYYPFIFYNASFGSSGTGFTSITTSYIPAGGEYNYPAFDLKNGLPYPSAQPLGQAGGRVATLRAQGLGIRAIAGRLGWGVETLARTLQERSKRL
jgi:hypothetical protein